jgi:predicted acyltransferase
MPRVAALDQFRGLAVLGMLVVNFLAPYAVVRADAPLLVHHAASFSLADAFLPMFLFASGAALRLRGGAVRPEPRRAAALLLLALLVYPLEDVGKSPLHELFKRHYFQALTHIALSGLWVLPVVARGPRVRAAYAAASLGLYVALSAAFYHDWIYRSPRCVEGGPLGFLGWSAVVLAGSIAGEVLDVRRLAAWGAGLMALGYAVSCLPGRWAPLPFTFAGAPPPDLFTMSQRGVTTSYVLFGAGLSIAVLALLVRIGSARGTLFGRRALAVYVFHLLAAQAFRPFLAKDASWAAVLAGLALFLGLCAALVRLVELRPASRVS